MIEVLLVVVVLAVLAFHAFSERQHNQERANLVNALMSKNAQEYRDLQLTAKVQPITPPTGPEFIAESDLTDEEFMKQIEETGNG